jgi:hypothetical protein
MVSLLIVYLLFTYCLLIAPGQYYKYIFLKYFFSPLKKVFKINQIVHCAVKSKMHFELELSLLQEKLQERHFFKLFTTVRLSLLYIVQLFQLRLTRQ